MLIIVVVADFGVEESIDDRFLAKYFHSLAKGEQFSDSVTQ